MRIGSDQVRVDGAVNLDDNMASTTSDGTASARQRAIEKRDAGGPARTLSSVGQVLRHDKTAVNEQVELLHVLGSRKDIIDEQRSDPSIGPLITRIENEGSKPEVGVITKCGQELKRYWGQWESLTICGGVLYRKFESPDGVGVHLQVIMPAKLRVAFLHRIHSDRMAGHLGREKTIKRVQQRAYWFKWREDVKNFCLTCDLCASRKPPFRRPRAPMQQHLTGVPMERVSLDVLGPLPKSNADNKFILLICDYFTKWVEAFPLPDQEAKTIADKFVKEFVCR
jgi:hypothetical protein